MFSKNLKPLDFGRISLPSHLQEVSQECQHHGFYKTLVDKNTKEIASGCPECEEALEIAKINSDRIQHLHKISGVPPIYSGKGLADYEVSNDSQRAGKAVAESFADNHMSNPAGGLIIAGNPGTGKTHLAIGVIKKLINLGLYCRYTTVGDLFSSVKSTYNNGALATEDEIAESYIQPSVLVIDEVGMSQMTKFEDGLMYRIINGRYERGKATIAISNQHIDDLKIALGDRLVDRLRENGGRLINMQHGSYRR